ncbi:hypothetical protein DIPPA_06135 [Diplonema papillatum]|nr:hypothetical protein DIPPA_06135 [Diplonema papillatum]
MWGKSGGTLVAALLVSFVPGGLGSTPSGDAAVSQLLEGVVIRLSDWELNDFDARAENIQLTDIAVQGARIRLGEAAEHWGVVELTASRVEATASFNVSLVTAHYANFVSMYLRDVRVTANLSNPQRRLADAGASQVEVTGLHTSHSQHNHTCISGVLCDVLIAMVDGYLADPTYTALLRDRVSDILTPFLRQLAAVPSPHPEEVAARGEKMLAEVPDLHNLRSSPLAQGVSLIANGVYGVRQEDGNTALGQMLKHFFPTLYVALNTTFPVVSGWTPDFRIGSLSLGLESVLLTDYAVPSLAVEVIGDYSMALSVTLSQVKGTVGGSLIVADKPNGNTDYAGAMVADVKDGAIQFNVSIMVAANETQYATLPLGSLLYPNVGGAQTAEGFVAELVRRAMLQEAEDGSTAASKQLITQMVQELLMGNPELASMVNCWLQYPLVALKLSTFLMNGVSYLLRSPIEDVQTEVNTLLQYMTHTSGENPCSSSYTMPESVASFNDSGSVMKTIDTLVNTYIGTEGPWSINAYLDAIAGLNIEADFHYLYETTTEYGDLALKLSNFDVSKMENRRWLDSMVVLRANNATVLANELMMGGVGLSMDVGFTFLPESSDLFSNEVSVQLSLESIRVLVDVLAEFSFPRLMMTPLGHMLSLSTGCLLGSLERVRLPKAVLLMLPRPNFLADVVCIECRSPGFKQLHETMATPEGNEAMRSMMKRAIGMIDGGLNSEMLPRMIDYELFAAQAECTATIAENDVVSGAAGTSASRVRTTTETTVPAPASYKAKETAGPMTNAKALAIIYTISGAILLAFTVHAVWALATWNRENAATENLPLILHPSISGWVRWGVPLFILGTVAVFLTANLVLGAAVSGLVSVGGTEMYFGDLSSYALGSTVRDMWNAEVYFLAVVILFSGIWPYFKLAALVWGWVVPPSALSGKRRGHLLQILDYTGKWSLMDTMMMIMLMASFRMHYVLSAMFLPVNFFSFDLMVEPGWGVYGFMTGAIMSLAVNHLMVIAHRNAQKHDETKGVSSSWFREADMAKADERLVLATHGWAGVTEQQSKMRAGAVIALLVLSLVLLILGATINTFSFEFDGVTAYLLHTSKPGSQNSEYSLLELATSVTGQHDVQSYDFGLWYIAVVFVLFTFVAPILQVVGLIVLWVAPLTLREQKYLLFFNEVIAAWCALEVFVFVVIVTVVQMQDLSEFLVVERCQYFDWLLRSYVEPIGGLQGYEPTCFKVKAELLAGCWILFCAAIASVMSYTVSWNAAAGVIQQRHCSQERRCSIENEPVHENNSKSEPCAHDWEPCRSWKAPATSD